MNDNEIIKALECCLNNDWNKTKCNECSFYTGCLGCVDELRKSVLDLINRQKAEIDGLIAGQETLQKCIAERMAEIKILQEKSVADDKLLNDRVQEAVNSVSKANQKYVDALEKAFNEKVAELKTAKSEAIKEFAERFKKEIFSTTHFNGYVYSDLVLSVFDNLVKEMTENDFKE